MALLAWIAIGFVAGIIARLFVHTGRRFGCLGTILLGMAGSLVGGALGSLVSDEGLELTRAGWIGSILGAIVILVVLRFVDSGERT